MDGIGKDKKDPDADAKPSSLKKYMSGNFSAFTFCQNELEQTHKKDKNSGSNSHIHADHSSESRASRLLVKKIVVG